MSEQRVTDGNRGWLFAEPRESEAATVGGDPVPAGEEGKDGAAAWEGYSLETLTRLLDS